MAGFDFMLQQSESLLARDVVGGPQDMPRSPLSASPPQPRARPLISEQGNGPVVMAGALAGAHRRPQCKERLERVILWRGHGDLSGGIAGDLMVEGISLVQVQVIV